MAEGIGKFKKKHYVKAAVLGVLSLVLYTVLFTKQHILNETFAKGGYYALLPIATAFLFSFVHGGFTGHFWDIIGISAKKEKR
ncbi:MAG: hypothetical protein L7F77_13030 [Candidatus Magnetominusculus sp. LBB02]|nr:hypothetical protein [Candidatus Magnetominusculus sp. LBB02]